MHRLFVHGNKEGINCLDSGLRRYKKRAENPMNILYIDHYAGSKELGRSFRPYYLGQEWIKKGCKLTVVGASYSHLRTTNPKPGISHDKGICYIWLWTPLYKGNGVGRILSMIVFIAQLFLHIPKIIKISKPDNIIASTVYMLDIIPAWFIKKILRKTPMLTFELHDIWPMSPMQLGDISPYNPYIIFLKLAEKLVYKICDNVASILPNSFEYIQKFGLKQEQVFYVPNGIVVDDWCKIEKEKHTQNNCIDNIKGLKNQGFFLLGYVGSHSTANALDNLIDAALLLTSHNVRIILIGNGSEKEALRSKAKAKKLDHVLFFDAVPKKYIPNILELFDVLYIGFRNLSVYRYGINPNKIFDYMMSARPIISAITAQYNPIKEAGCGFHVPSDNPEKLAKMIEHVIDQPQQKLNKMGTKGKIFVMNNHSYEKIANVFLNSIKG
jgi:glycosyltransferase involved in cell wall biosynthesis